MQPGPQRRQLRLRGQIGLVQHQQIRRPELAFHGVRQQGVRGRLADVPRVRQHDDALQLQHGIGQAHLRDAAGVRHAARLDDNPFGQWIQRQHPRQRVVQAAGHRAADTAVGQPDHIVGALRDQAGVDIDGPEIVDQHRRAAWAGRQHVVQQGGLARTQEAAHHRQGNPRHLTHPEAPADGRR
ncbi:hypothetical protein D3C85_1314040 [compost metagenome]